MVRFFHHSEIIKTKKNLNGPPLIPIGKNSFQSSLRIQSITANTSLYLNQKKADEESRWNYSREVREGSQVFSWANLPLKASDWTWLFSPGMSGCASVKEQLNYSAHLLWLCEDEDRGCTLIYRGRPSQMIVAALKISLESTRIYYRPGQTTAQRPYMGSFLIRPAETWRNYINRSLVGYLFPVLSELGVKCFRASKTLSLL